MCSTKTGRMYSRQEGRHRPKLSCFARTVPSERHLIPPLRSPNETLDSASTSHNAAHVAGATRIAPAGRRGGATGASGKAVGDNRERMSPPTTNAVDSDDEGEGGEQEDEDARASYFYAFPEVARETIKEVIIRQCCSKAGVGILLKYFSKTRHGYSFYYSGVGVMSRTLALAQYLQ